MKFPKLNNNRLSFVILYELNSAIDYNSLIEHAYYSHINNPLNKVDMNLDIEINFVFFIIAKKPSILKNAKDLTIRLNNLISTFRCLIDHQKDSTRKVFINGPILYKLDRKIKLYFSIEHRFVVHGHLWGQFYRHYRPLILIKLTHDTLIHILTNSVKANKKLSSSLLSKD